MFIPFIQSNKINQQYQFMAKTLQGWKFDNTYARLSKSLFSRIAPKTNGEPSVLLFNNALANEMGLSLSVSEEEQVAALLAGKLELSGAEPLAQAYAGHQFGHFTMLGDGRAILLGEHLTPKGQRLDVQLKGGGQTPYSRRGDGRATLRAMLREYLISEVMHGLGIPTSRSLAVVLSGEKVFRDGIHEGAILTRIASSHIRVGTFEYIKNFLNKEELEQFADYTIQRHYPALLDKEGKVLALLQAVMERQIDLIVDWMRVGFIHGVMNTDNMSIAGETFDYGPCAFMNAYDPHTVFSSIDTAGRYAYGNQPKMAQWNLACFAGALLPLLNADSTENIERVKAILNAFPHIYEQRWTAMMARKLGILSYDDALEVKKLVQAHLDWMQTNKADYTNTFLVLSGDMPKDGIYLSPTFEELEKKRLDYLVKVGISESTALETMRAANPMFIPRNHLVEEALDAVAKSRDFTLFNQLLEVAESPYRLNPNLTQLQAGPAKDESGYRTFCGT